MSAAEVQHHGSLFTLFLHSPLTALCYICNVGDVPIHHWERCQSYVDHFITEASRLVTRCRIDEIDQGYIGNVLFKRRKFRSNFLRKENLDQNFFRRKI